MALCTVTGQDVELEPSPDYLDHLICPACERRLDPETLAEVDVTGTVVFAWSHYEDLEVDGEADK